METVTPRQRATGIRTVGDRMPVRVAARPGTQVAVGRSRARDDEDGFLESLQAVSSTVHAGRQPVSSGGTPIPDGRRVGR